MMPVASSSSSDASRERVISGDSITSTSTPASRNPSAVSASVRTTSLYKDQLLPHPVRRHTDGLTLDDDSQVRDLVLLAVEICDCDSDPLGVPNAGLERSSHEHLFQSALEHRDRSVFQVSQCSGVQCGCVH